jgi:dimethylhistidine N-methyltransferase
MSIRASALTLAGFSAPGDRLREEVLQGLRRARKRIPSKYFYDARGSELFEKICELDEYYLTRAELEIMKRHAGEMGAALGRHCFLIEYGSGSGRKTRLLLEQLVDPAAYVPIDISDAALRASVTAIAAANPLLEVIPICADYTRSVKLKPPSLKSARRAIYFPGSTIGNFTRSEARGFLARASAQVGAAGGILIGADLKKNARVLEAAYDDREGVTAAFNMNLLARANREMGADFHPSRFRHRAFYDRLRGRIEMHLVSLVRQSVRVADELFLFDAGESILTEYSYKYSVRGFTALARQVGLRVRRCWTDPARRFAVYYLTRPGAPRASQSRPLRASLVR